MNIDIKVNGEQKNLQQSQLQVIRRMINIMQEHDFDITLSFDKEDEHDNSEPYVTKLQGGRYPSVHTHI